MEKISSFTALVLVLAIVGAINWGLVGFFNWNLINAIFGGASRGDYSAVTRIIYSLVGLAGLLMIVLFTRLRELSRVPAGRRAEVRP